MSDKYTLIISEVAKVDIAGIYEYIGFNLKNAKAANDMIDLITNELLSLEDNPKGCAYALDEKLFNLGYRTCVIKKYVALYIIDEEQKQVQVEKVFYGPRDTANLGLF